jgi:hypothetical protein
MFGRRFFGGAYFGPRFFGDGGDATPVGPSASAIWAYVLSNGKSAGQNLVENNAMLLALTSGSFGWDTPIEGGYTAGDLLRIVAGVAAGTTRITPLGAGAAHVEFDAVDGSRVIVAAEMQGSERTSVVIDAPDP